MRRMRGACVGAAVLCGCTATVVETTGKVEEAAPVLASQGRPERWVSRGPGPGVCAWRGHTFEPADFHVMEPMTGDLCLAYADCSWRVEGKDGAITLAIAGAREPDPPLPFAISREEGRSLGLWGTMRRHKVVDGWLAVFDAGEFGSGIWWFSEDWTRREKLIEEHVVGFFTRGEEVWAPGGINHLGPTPGPVLRFTRDAAGKWSARPTTETLRAGAEAALLEGDTLVVVTPRSVEAVAPDGGIRVLATSEWSGLYPETVARGPGGELYVGMRHVVARLVPDGAGRYREEWLVPPPCREWGFIEGIDVCACKGLVGEEPLATHPGWGGR